MFVAGLHISIFFTADYEYPYLPLIYQRFNCLGSEKVWSFIDKTDNTYKQIITTAAGGEVSGLSDDVRCTKLLTFLSSFGNTDIRFPLTSKYSNFKYVSSEKKYFYEVKCLKS